MTMAKELKSLKQKSSKEYIPQKQDIIYIDFNPSSGIEIQKRRPAVVVSSYEYSLSTGYVAVCPITSSNRSLFIPVHDEVVFGYVNPFQLHTFDFRSRNAKYISFMETSVFQKVVQSYQFIFD